MNHLLHKKELIQIIDIQANKKIIGGTILKKQRCFSYRHAETLLLDFSNYAPHMYLNKSSCYQILRGLRDSRTVGVCLGVRSVGVAALWSEYDQVKLTDRKLLPTILIVNRYSKLFVKQKCLMFDSSSL